MPIGHLNELASLGVLYLTSKGVQKATNEILESKNGAGYEPVGVNWVDPFVERHQDKLQTHWSKPLDTRLVLDPSIQL